MARPTTQIARLRILATSDVHMHLLAHDYFADEPTPGLGLQALAPTLAELRRQAQAEDPPRHVLLVDNGDTLQGNVLGDHLATHCARTGAHPVAQVMNALGYDAMGLGNHDLDYGLGYLGWFARSLDAPLVSSNTVLAPARDWLKRDCLLTAGDLTVGVLSVLPPRTVEALHAQIGGEATCGDMIEAALRAARDLREAGADVVLCLAHTGLDPGDAEQALAEIARTGAVDALVGGHQHGVFPGPVPPGTDADPEAGTLHGIPTVMPGCGGALLGCIDLDLQRTHGQRWTITQTSARVRPPTLATTGEDCAFDPIRPVHAATCAALDQVVGRTGTALNSYFAQVRPTRLHVLTAAAQRAAIAAAAKGTRHAGLPLLSAVSLPRAGGTGGARNYTDIPAGPLTARHVAELCIYANRIWAVEVSGAELAEWLERSASAFAQVGGAQPAGLFDSAFPAFDFDVIHGLTYSIDPTMPARYDRSGALRHTNNRRISRVEHDGTPVRAETRFLVAVNSFRACGGGQFPGLHPGRPVLRPDLPAAGMIEAHLASSDAPDDAPIWGFADGCAGAACWFDTGPGALRHLDEIAHLSPGTPQPQPSGFVRIPITL